MRYSATGKRYLVRHSVTKCYYARVKAGGMARYRSLGTTDEVEALQRLPETIAAERAGVGTRRTLSKPRPPRVRPGWVYFLKAAGAVKIGCTSRPDVEYRITALQVSHPDPVLLELLIPTDNIIPLEREIHALFAAKRIRGEWFRLDSADIQQLKNRYGAALPASLPNGHFM